jgi:hypothetical protein
MSEMRVESEPTPDSNCDRMDEFDRINWPRGSAGGRMRKPPTRVVPDEESHQAAQEPRQAKPALDSLARLIVESFVKTIPPDVAAALSLRLKTKEGKKEFAESWPIIVDAYFSALCNPKR